MYKISIDDTTHQLEHGEGETVFDALMKAQESLWDEEMALEAIQVNGQEVELDEEMLRAIDVEGAHIQVTLSDADEERSIATMIEDSRAYLQSLNESVTELAERIREEPSNESFGDMSKVMLGIAAVMELIETLLTFPDVPEDVKQEAGETTRSFKENIEELNEAQEVEDVVLIADILEFEFPEITKKLADLLGRIAPHAPEQ